MVEWRYVEGASRYQISSEGELGSYFSTNGRTRSEMRLLTPQIDKDGYVRYALITDNGERVNRFVHHLVLEAFVGPRPLGLVARHGPNGIRDNSVDNLCWGTHQQNTSIDKLRDGTLLFGEMHYASYLIESQVIDIRSLHGPPGMHYQLRRKLGLPLQCELAEEFKTSTVTVSHIVAGRTWKHLWLTNRGWWSPIDDSAS